MQQLDVATDDAWRNFLPGMAQEDDRALIVEFFVGKKLLGAKSIAAGREIYEDREYVRIRIKGQDKQEVIEEVKPRHKTSYPIAYQIFLSQKPAPVVGTPIEQLPGVGPSMAHTLKGLNLRSIEDLAGVTDENALSRIGMGARDMVRKAQAFLNQTTDRALALEEENRQLKGRLAQQGEAIEALQKQMAELAAAGGPRKGGRGRSPMRQRPEPPTHTEEPQP